MMHDQKSMTNNSRSIITNLFGSWGNLNAFQAGEYKGNFGPAECAKAQAAASNWLSAENDSGWARLKRPSV